MNVKECVAEKILEISPQAICDDCLANTLGLSVRQHANHKTKELQNEPGYRRAKGTCFSYGNLKLVITRVDSTNSRSNGIYNHVAYSES